MEKNIRSKALDLFIGLNFIKAFFIVNVNLHSPAPHPAFQCEKLHERTYYSLKNVDQKYLAFFFNKFI